MQLSIAAFFLRKYLAWKFLIYEMEYTICLVNYCNARHIDCTTGWPYEQGKKQG